MQAPPMQTEHAHGLADGLGQWTLYGVASGWWALGELWRHGPSWSVVPPLLIACASVITATDRFLTNRRKERP